jgi:hypothetical protein
MSLIDIARTVRQPPAGGGVRHDIADAYDDARARALALVPVARSERVTVEAIAPVDGRRSIPPAVRLLAYTLAAAAAAGATSVATAAPSAVGLAAAFGLATALAGDRIGAALRGIRARREWSGRAMLTSALLAHGIEAAVLVLAGGLVSGSPLAAAGLGVLALCMAAIGFASRIGDPELEARAALRAKARQRLDATEQDVRRAVEALQQAHAGDLARIAAEMGSPPPAGGRPASADAGRASQARR